MHGLTGAMTHLGVTGQQTRLWFQFPVFPVAELAFLGGTMDWSQQLPPKKDMSGLVQA